MRKADAIVKISSLVGVLFFLFGAITGPSASWAAPKPTRKVNFRGPSGAKGLPVGWSLKVHRGKAQASLLDEDGKEVLHMKSVKSSFALEHGVAVNIRKYNYLAWTWKAVSLPSKGDVRQRSKDDQALQLLVGFKDGKVISYVWDANAPKGTVVDRSFPWPFSIEIKVIVVQSGDSDLGKWVTNERNIYRDYRRLFGTEPPRAERIRVQMNSQHTHSRAEGYVSDVIFSRRTLVAESVPGARMADVERQR